MKRYFYLSLIILILISMNACRQETIPGKLLINHLGYLPSGAKNIVFQSNSDYSPKKFVIKNSNNEIVYKGNFKAGGKIDQWHTGNAFAGDFTDFSKEGQYYIETEIKGSTFKSHKFTIEEKLFTKTCLPLILEGFKSIHPAKKYEDWDSNVSFFGSREDRVDVHGGWYDASGDYSKYLSHLCYTNYMAPQQTPMVVYNLYASALHLKKKNNTDKNLIKQMIKEAAWGADFLMRMQDETGYFYTIVFDTWSKDPTMREICAYETQNGNRTEDYQAAFREGAGITIAALAKLGKDGISGEFSSKQYLESAIKGFDHLLENNTRYCDNGQENIIDDYTALMAATELYLATNDEKYLEHARLRADLLRKRLSNDENYRNWFRADQDGTRPYFHAAEAGYPIVALSNYLNIETDKALIDITAKSIQVNLDFELSITNEVHNPFGYPRQYVKDLNSTERRASFFIPHENESGYWYQGENARLASLVSAFNLAKPYLREDQKTQLHSYNANILNWILGLNPYDMSMLEGVGYNNPEYFVEKNWNYKGGIANGITAGVENKNDIAFLPEPQKDDPAQNWRWPEQWIPHAGWFIYAISLEE